MTRASAFTVAVLAVALALPAHAYHAATHAGLTERAALASSLHARLMQRFDRALGVYEPLALDGGATDPARRELLRRLAQLDPEGGYTPDRGRLSALGWLVAGAAIEGVPAERTRNHFYDPARGSGLDEVDGEALRTRVTAAANGVGSVRGIFTGTTFDGSGMAAPAWLRSADNEWGLVRFFDELERSAAAPTPAERDGALARALLAAGAIAHVVEDAGDPTFVRDDYRIALEADAGPYERFVVAEYGRVGVPELSGAPIAKSHLSSLFHDGDGSGLADRTQSRFFTPGTLPDSARYTRPQTAPGNARAGYASGGGIAHLAHYERTQRGVFWSLDERCFGDYARALLPETARYAAGALELLFRGRLEIATANGSATVTAHELPLGRGKVTLYADVAGSARRLVRTRDVAAASDGEAILDVALPAGARHVAAVFRGVDGGGEPVVVVQEHTIK